MKYLSVCSGIEAASVAWPMWSAVAFSEIEAFPCAVLKHHYPNTPNWGDMTRFKDWPDANVDLLVGGTPCQSFSVAGLRKGLDDPRGSLMLTYLAIARRYRPRWLVWENVPGVLSADDGRAFGSLLGGLAELGYGFAYRILDAQYFGLAQRRARVFVVGHLGDWRRAAAVLFERESLSGHPAPRREAGQRLADSLTVGANQCSGTRSDIVEASTGDISHCLNAGGMGRIDYETETLIAHALRADGFDASEDGTGRGTPIVATTAPTIGQRMRGQIDAMFDGALIPIDMRQASRGATMTNNRAEGVIGGGAPGTGIGKDGDPSPTIASSHVPAIAFHENQRGELTVNDTAGSLKVGGGKPGQGYPAVAFNWQSGGDARGLKAQAQAQALSRSQTPAMQRGMQVRRLTPRECERLQGFPDDYTLITYRGKPAADGPRYKALGNSMAVPVMAYIGRRIQMVEDITKAVA